MLFIQIYPYVCSVQWKKLCSCILKISVDHLPWVWKKKLLFWKKSGKRLEFWIQKSVRILYWLLCHWRSSHCGIHKSVILLAVTQWLISIPQGGGVGGGGGIKTSQLLNLSTLHTRGTEWPSVRVVPLWFVLTLLQVFFLHLFLSRLSLVVERENDDRIVTLNDITHSLKSNSARKVRLRIRLLWYV